MVNQKQERFGFRLHIGSGVYARVLKGNNIESGDGLLFLNEKDYNELKSSN